MSEHCRPLLDAFAEEPERFDFFAALRLWEAAYPDRPRLGEGRRAGDEPLRLGQPPHLAFPPAQLAGFAPASDGRPPRLAAYLFGLFGPQGPLPLHLTVHARDRLRRHQDSSFGDFCDVFHHRMLAFFYRAWADARPTVEQDRPLQDRFARRLGTLSGLATPAFMGRHALPDRFVLYAAGLFAMQSRPAEMLARLVAGFFKVPVRVEEFVGAWLEIPPADRARLGTARLGRDAVLGVHRFERGQRFRLELGPLTFAQFRRLLPHGDALRLLQALVHLAVGPELDWDARLVLRREEVPAARLDGGTRLGWTSWLWTAYRAHDAGDLVLDGGAFQGGSSTCP
jgi:type VI secretion system protein ImpH